MQDLPDADVVPWMQAQPGCRAPSPWMQTSLGADSPWMQTPPWTKGMTHTCENITFLQLLLWAVIKEESSTIV